MNYQTPVDSKLADILGMVLGLEAKAKETKAANKADLSHVAVFCNAEDDIVATCRCNLSTAAALGCALSMIPPGGVEAMLEDGVLTEMANDNFYEMMNICSSLLMNEKSEHLRLTEIVVDASKSLEGEGHAEIAFDLDLSKYGTGTLVFNHT